MFSGKFKIEKDEDGNCFIDRDGTHFRFILNYLWDGDLPTTHFKNKNILDELIEEVWFYQIDSLLERLEQKQNSDVGTEPIDYIKLLELLNLSPKPIQAPSLRLCGMKISYLNFSQAIMPSCDFSSVVALEVNFNGANLCKSNFSEANLKSATFLDANIQNCTFVNAGLSGADMWWVKASDCDFTRAKMSGVDLREATLDSSKLTDANLIVANLENASMHFVRLEASGANLDWANLKGVKGLAS